MLCKINIHEEPQGLMHISPNNFLLRHSTKMIREFKQKHFRIELSKHQY